MGTGELAIVVTLGIGFLATLIAVVVLIRQSGKDAQAVGKEMREVRRELRDEIRELGNQLVQRVSEAELEQARIHVRHELVTERLSRQEDLHQTHAD